MLHNRNTYKNCKMMRVYLAVNLFSLIMMTVSFLLMFIKDFFNFAVVFLILSAVSFIASFLMLYIKNNNYKLKYYFKLNEFKKEFKLFERCCSGNKKRIKEIRNQQRDQFLQFGKSAFSSNNLEPEKNNWNDWIEDACAFNYGTAKYMEKLSYLTYQLYNACASGGGFEEFFNSLSYEPFTKNEILEIINKNNFFNKDFKTFVFKIIQEFNQEKEDELFARYEEVDNKTFFTFENLLEDCGEWLANNRVLLSSCVGVYLHGNVEYDIYRLFLSSDYKKVIFVYSIDNKVFKVNYKIWNKSRACWNDTEDDNGVVYDNLEEAFNDIKSKIKDYIELEI